MLVIHKRKSMRDKNRNREKASQIYVRNKIIRFDFSPHFSINGMHIYWLLLLNSALLAIWRYEVRDKEKAHK